MNKEFIIFLKSIFSIRCENKQNISDFIYIGNIIKIPFILEIPFLLLKQQKKLFAYAGCCIFNSQSIQLYEKNIQL